MKKKKFKSNLNLNKSIITSLDGLKTIGGAPSGLPECNSYDTCVVCGPVTHYGDCTLECPWSYYCYTAVGATCNPCDTEANCNM